MFGFLFSLLQEQYSKNKYSNVLVCGLAVLGVRTLGARWGWIGADNYPPILSKVIKIARLIVIKQAFRFSGQDIGDSSSDSGSSRLDNSEDRSESSRTESSGCLELIKKFMDQFMVRGTHSAMQWMLDLRTYGRKIHNKTTAEGSYPTCART